MTTIAAPAATSLGIRRWSGPAHTFAILLMRDFRVLRRDIISFLIRTTLQPVLFVFVFSFVLPKIGSHGGPSPFGAAGAPGIHFSTILLPGMVASAVMFQGLFAVTTPLVMELSYTKEIEDRVLAPLPVWMLAMEKIVAGATQATAAAIIVFPLVMLIHAKGQAPSVAFGNWPLLVPVVLLAALCTSSLALLIGTVVDPRRLSTMFGIIVVPMTMLGCVYYPWQELHVVRWLQIVALLNPLVYISEALRAVLTPVVPHMHIWLLLIVLGGGVIVSAFCSIRTFTRRLVD